MSQLDDQKAKTRKANELKREAEDRLKKETAAKNKLARELARQEKGGKDFGDSISLGLQNATPFIFATALVGAASAGSSMLLRKLDVQTKIKETFDSETRAAFTIVAIEQALAFAVAFMVCRTIKSLNKYSDNVITLAAVTGIGALVRWLLDTLDDKLLSE
jgi:hypothetical protein